MKNYSIGHGEENDVVIHDRLVSRNHAELSVDGEGKFRLIDLNSTNSTFIRDGEEWVQIYEAYIAEDEQIMFGSTATTVTALLAKKTIEPDGTLTDAAADEEASGTPAKAEATGEEALQGPARRADNMSLGENADSAAGAFHGILERVKSLNKGGRLSRDFPDEWTGECSAPLPPSTNISPSMTATIMAVFSPTRTAVPSPCHTIMALTVRSSATPSRGPDRAPIATTIAGRIRTILLIIPPLL